MRHFCKSAAGSLLDFDRIDGVFHDGNGKWSLVVSGSPMPVSKEFADWVASQISESSSVVDVPFGISLVPPSDE